MLTDLEEIKLVSTAGEPGLRDPKRTAQGVEEIVADFLAGRLLAGMEVLELGPGHYEFCEIVRRLGGRASVLEFDPVIAELGRRRGYAVYVQDLRQIDTFAPQVKFDGLLCKGSNDPFWFHNDRAALERYVAALRLLVKPEGWIWTVACPPYPEIVGPQELNTWLEVEREVYRAQGFQEWRIPSSFVGAYYGISVRCEGLIVYTYGLSEFKLRLRTRAWLLYRAIRASLGRLLRGFALGGEFGRMHCGDRRDQ